MTPATVAYVIPRMSIGGAQTHLLQVLRLLDRRRFRPLLCCLATDRKDPLHLLDQVRELGVPILDARLRDTANSLVRPHSFAQMARVAGEFRRQRVRIVHSYLFHANWFGTLTARLARVPVAIVSKRSMDVYPRARDRWACSLVNRLADCVTAVAAAVRDHVHQTEGCPLEKIVIIPNGIATPSVPTTSSAHGRAQALSVNADDKVVGTITRLVWKRGHEELLRAAALVARAEPTAKFVVVGDGPLRRALEEQARGLGLNGGVRFLGAVPQAARLLPHFDVFVLSSVWEGMSNGLLEAMAAGRPVVATRVGGNPEVVVDGESGLLVPPKDPQALADAVLRLLRDRELARRLGEAARRRIESEFTLEQMVQRLESLYDDLLARRRPAA
jgi:L-malate glycosyltransferase